MSECPQCRSTALMAAEVRAAAHGLWCARCNRRADMRDRALTVLGRTPPLWLEEQERLLLWKSVQFVWSTSYPMKRRQRLTDLQARVSYGFIHTPA